MGKFLPLQRPLGLLFVRNPSNQYKCNTHLGPSYGMAPCNLPWYSELLALYRSAMAPYCELRSIITQPWYRTASFALLSLSHGTVLRASLYYHSAMVPYCELRSIIAQPWHCTASFALLSLSHGTVLRASLYYHSAMALYCELRSIIVQPWHYII